jgi:DNA invertase Pin-like site-specific DNA recombinase
LAYVAEQERQNIKQRQEEGIEIAKAKGKHLGRLKATFSEGFDGVYKRWKDGQSSINS